MMKTCTLKEIQKDHPLTYRHSTHVLYIRWIDDIFALMCDHNDSITFHTYFNRQHHRIQVPVKELQMGDSVNFLDCHIYKQIDTK